MDSICERHTGALVKLTPSGDRKTWNVHQESVLPPLPHFEGWKPIDWKPEDGPIQVTSTRRVHELRLTITT